MKRQPAQPRTEHIVSLKEQKPENITPIPYETYIETWTVGSGVLAGKMGYGWSTAWFLGLLDYSLFLHFLTHGKRRYHGADIVVCQHGFHLPIPVNAVSCSSVVLAIAVMTAYDK